MKIKIKWDKPFPKANKNQAQRTYATNPNGSSRWGASYDPEKESRHRWFLYCMTSEINFSATGSTFAEAEENWLEKMERHLEACQQLMADIKAGKNV